MENQSFDIPQELRYLDLGFTIFYAAWLLGISRVFGSTVSFASFAGLWLWQGFTGRPDR